MRAVRVALRAIVYGTEDEDRIVRSLLEVMGRPDDAAARSRMTRSRIKSHYGAEVLLYEAILKSPKELRTFFDRLRAAPAIAPALREEFRDRLDEDLVLHFRLDKQAAVGGELRLGTGGDAIDVGVKYERRGQDVEGFPFDESS